MAKTVMSTPLTPSALTERAKALAEPAWLSETRLAALEGYRTVDAPKWARTDLTGLDVEALLNRAAATLPATRTARPKVEGLVAMPLAQAAREHPELVKEALTAPITTEDKWTRLHRALWSGGNLVFVEKNKEIDEPIQLVNAHGAHGAVLRDIITISQGSKAHVILRANGAGPGALSMESLDVTLHANAKLQLATLQDVNHATTLLSERRARIARDASLHWIDGQFGGARVRAVNESNLDGQGAGLVYVGAFFGSKDQHFDITTSALHHAAHSSSQLTMKGALSDDGYSVNYSIVNIGPLAKNSSGHQHQETLVLSDKARADAIPKLDVENNDVSASHGATVGQVDPEQVFYLRSRGLTDNGAKRLVVEGFFEPLLKEIPVDEIRNEIRHAILARMKD